MGKLTLKDHYISLYLFVTFLFGGAAWDFSNVKQIAVTDKRTTGFKVFTEVKLPVVNIHFERPAF